MHINTDASSDANRPISDVLLRASPHCAVARRNLAAQKRIVLLESSPRPTAHHPRFCRVLPTTHAALNFSAKRDLCWHSHLHVEHVAQALPEILAQKTTERGRDELMNEKRSSLKKCNPFEKQQLRMKRMIRRSCA